MGAPAAAPVASRAGRQAGRDSTHGHQTHGASPTCSSSMTNSEPIEITEIVVKRPTKTIFQPPIQTE